MLIVFLHGLTASAPVNVKVKIPLPLPPTLPVLSADRVEQMTKTYNDMEVVTQLLVEVSFFFSLSKLPPPHPLQNGII